MRPTCGVPHPREAMAGAMSPIGRISPQTMDTIPSSRRVLPRRMPKGEAAWPFGYQGPTFVERSCLTEETKLCSTRLPINYRQVFLYAHVRSASGKMSRRSRAQRRSARGPGVPSSGVELAARILPQISHRKIDRTNPATPSAGFGCRRYVRGCHVNPGTGRNGAEIKQLQLSVPHRYPVIRRSATALPCD